jgi:hypothetical protein
MPKLFPFSAEGGAMTRERTRAIRQVASLFITVGLGAVTVAACGGGSQQSAPSGTSSSSPPAAAMFDISHIDNVKNQFPPGFKTEPHAVKTLNQDDINNTGISALNQAQFDPPQCRAALIPPYAVPSVGTQAAGVSGSADQGEIFVMALQLPQPVPASQPVAGCDHVKMSGAPEVTGTAEPIPAPKIDGVTTAGVKLSPADKDDVPEYVFAAELGNQTSVVVMGSAADELNPQQLLSDLLVKSTAAVRGS